MVKELYMKRSASQMLSLMSLFLITAGVLTSCGERGPKQGAQERVEVEDGGDPTPTLRKKAVKYLTAVSMAKDGPQERAAIVSLVEWLKSVGKVPSVMLTKQDSRRATIQEVEAYAKSKEPVSLRVDLFCFPPRYESLEHTFRDNSNIRLFHPVLWFEETGANGEKRRP
jgi:hypothetical protein